MASVLILRVGIMVAAIAEAMLQNPNEATRKELDLAYRALNEHYNSGRKAYSAWITKVGSRGSKKTL